jgi:hypothetical protein
LRFRIGSLSCTRVGSWRWGPCATSSASRSTRIREVCWRRLFMLLCAADALRRYQARQLTSPRFLRDVPSHRDANTSNLPAQPVSRQKCGMATRAWCAVSKRLSDETWYAPPWTRPRPCSHLMCRFSVAKESARAPTTIVTRADLRGAPLNTCRPPWMQSGVKPTGPWRSRQASTRMSPR